MWLDFNGVAHHFLDYNYLLSIIFQNGQTPVFAASRNGHAEVCRILIKDGKADVNREAKVQIIDKLYRVIKTQSNLPIGMVYEAKKKKNK